MKGSLHLIVLQLYLFLLMGCASTNSIQHHYTFEDKQVFELVDKLKKDPNNKDAAELLPQAYNQALETRKSLSEANYNNLVGGDKYMALAKDWQVIQNMYEAIVSTPAAYKAVPSPMNASVQIQKEYGLAANEYYNQGMVYLSHNTRQYAQMAYTAFNNANTAIPGYKDVADKMALAKSLSTIRVVVNPVNYYNTPYSSWGFQNDFLQDQMVRDLNLRAYPDVKFYTNWQARSQSINADKVVDLNFTNINIGQVSSRSYSYKRSAEVQAGNTKSQPSTTVMTTVYATVYVIELYMQSFATLQCRIYNTSNNSNVMFDNFPSTYNWKYATARYTGDKRALQPQDWQLINNSSFTNAPGRNEIAAQLFRDSYNMLLSRINSNVRFSSQ